jgi:1-acyl-sn-glycerol-3-phosphate acyltransferase
MSTWRSDFWYRLNYSLVYATYTLGFSYRSAGSHHMPQEGPVLILANHESFLDPLAVGLAVRRKTHYLAKKTLFKGAFGDYLRSVGCVAVDQDGVAKEGLKTSVDLLKSGKALLIFPEGERAWDGKMQPFKPGVWLVLRRAPVTIVPVGVAGAHEAYPRGAKAPKFSPMFWPANGHAVSACVGKPIRPEEYAHLERESLLEMLFERVKSEVARAEQIKRRPSWQSEVHGQGA